MTKVKSSGPSSPAFWRLSRNVPIQYCTSEPPSWRAGWHPRSDDARSNEHRRDFRRGAGGPLRVRETRPARSEPGRIPERPGDRRSPKTPLTDCAAVPAGEEDVPEKRRQRRQEKLNRVPSLKYRMNESRAIPIPANRQEREGDPHDRAPRSPRRAAAPRRSAWRRGGRRPGGAAVAEVPAAGREDDDGSRRGDTSIASRVRAPAHPGSSTRRSRARSRSRTGKPSDEEPRGRGRTPRAPWCSVDHLARKVERRDREEHPHQLEDERETVRDVRLEVALQERPDLPERAHQVSSSLSAPRIARNASSMSGSPGRTRGSPRPAARRPREDVGWSRAPSWSETTTSARTIERRRSSTPGTGPRGPRPGNRPRAGSVARRAPTAGHRGPSPPLESALDQDRETVAEGLASRRLWVARRIVFPSRRFRSSSMKRAGRAPRRGRGYGSARHDRIGRIVESALAIASRCFIPEE